jgi:hypothetical protein
VIQAARRVNLQRQPVPIAKLIPSANKYVHETRISTFIHLFKRNCVNGLCLIPPEAPLKVFAWQYFLIILCLIGGNHLSSVTVFISMLTVLCVPLAMASTCVLLLIVHKRHRYYRYRELRQYYFEQLRLAFSFHFPMRTLNSYQLFNFPAFGAQLSPCILL